MSQREDVEALVVLFRDHRSNSCGHMITAGGNEYCACGWSGIGGHARHLASELAAHVEAVRVSERVRLAGEVEAPDDPVWNACWEAVANAAWPKEGATRSEVLDMLMGLRPVPGVRLTEEE